MRSGARSGSDGSTSVEAGRRVGASMKSRLAQPPRIVDVFDALRPSVRARWVWRKTAECKFNVGHASWRPQVKSRSEPRTHDRAGLEAVGVVHEHNFGN